MFDGLKNLGNLGSMIKQAQEMGGKLQAAKDELRSRRVTGSAGADLVTAEVNGAFEMVGCRIDASLVKTDDREMLEDLIVAAVNQALLKVKDMQVDTMKSITGGLPLPPGLGDLLGGEKGS